MIIIQQQRLLLVINNDFMIQYFFISVISNPTGSGILLPIAFSHSNNYACCVSGSSTDPTFQTIGWCGVMGKLHTGWSSIVTHYYNNTADLNVICIGY